MARFGLDLGEYFIADFLVGFGIGISIRFMRRRAAPPKPHLGEGAGGAKDPEARLVPRTVTLPLGSRTNASPFWVILLLVLGI